MNPRTKAWSHKQFDDEKKKTTGGRNGYGAKLANIFSTEFTVETADGASTFLPAIA